MRYAALLRGVNLGPSRRMPMAELRQVVGDAGFANVVTYLQSGNVVFDAPSDSELRSRLEAAIVEQFDIQVGVVLLSVSDIERVVEACPYRSAAEADPTKVHVTFVDPPLEEGFDADVDRERFLPDEYQAVAGVVYMHLPDGMGRSKLPAALDRALASRLVTTRNWRTVLALAEMLAD